MARMLTSVLFCLVMAMASARPLGPQSDPDPFQVVQVHMEEGCGMVVCDGVLVRVIVTMCAGTSDALEDRGHD
jgi:cytochrome b561